MDHRPGQLQKSIASYGRQKHIIHQSVKGLNLINLRLTAEGRF